MFNKEKVKEVSKVAGNIAKEEAKSWIGDIIQGIIIKIVLILVSIGLFWYISVGLVGYFKEKAINTANSAITMVKENKDLVINKVNEKKELLLKNNEKEDNISTKTEEKINIEDIKNKMGSMFNKAKEEANSISKKVDEKIKEYGDKKDENKN